MEAIPYDEYAKVIIESGVKIVETAGNNPKKWIPLFKKAGLTLSFTKTSGEKLIITTSRDNRTSKL